MIVVTEDENAEDETIMPPAAANPELGGGEEHEEEERFHLNDRVHCTVPPPMVLVEGTTSWESINKLGGWDAFLVGFPMLEEIPEQHKGVWSSDWSESLRRWRDADTEQEDEFLVSGTTGVASRGEWRSPPGTIVFLRGTGLVWWKGGREIS